MVLRMLYIFKGRFLVCCLCIYLLFWCKRIVSLIVCFNLWFCGLILLWRVCMNWFLRFFLDVVLFFWVVVSLMLRVCKFFICIFLFKVVRLFFILLYIVLLSLLIVWSLGLIVELVVLFSMFLDLELCCVICLICLFCFCWVLINFECLCDCLICVLVVNVFRGIRECFNKFLYVFWDWVLFMWVVSIFNLVLNWVVRVLFLFLWVLSKVWERMCVFGKVVLLFL